jgi:hypothetical protein
MRTQVTLAADARTLEALAKFLSELEKLRPEPVLPPKAVQGEDNVVYVEVGYRTEEETFQVGDRMAEVGADLVEETGVLVALAPFVVEESHPA